MVTNVFPYEDEELVSGLLTCEFRGWVEPFGEEMPFTDITTGVARWQYRYRVTQAGRAVLDRTQMIANLALLFSAFGIAIAILSLAVTIRNSYSAPHAPAPTIEHKTVKETK